MPRPVIGLQTHIWDNNLKSALLLAAYPFIIGAIIWACAFVFGIAGSVEADPAIANRFATSIIFAYWPLILTGVVIWFTIAFFFHTKMIRHMAHSHPVTRKEEPELYNLFENLCISVGLPTPRLEIIETHARNAFASGINKKTYAVTVTRGLLQSLTKEEVEAVLAHEITHIMNRDVRLLIITIIFTGMIGFAAQLAWSQLRYGLYVGGRGGNRKGGGILIYLGIVAILWIGYLATLFTRFAISRRREYMADAGAVQMTKNPEGMMRALMRIAGSDRIPKIPGDIAMMCIENSAPFMGLFATHPPMEKRIRMIAETTGAAVPSLPQPSPWHAVSAPREETLVRPVDGRANWTTRQRFKKRREGNPWHNTGGQR
jgi:heat shock protein HtpX